MNKLEAHVCLAVFLTGCLGFIMGVVYAALLSWPLGILLVASPVASLYAMVRLAEGKVDQ